MREEEKLKKIEQDIEEVQKKREKEAKTNYKLETELKIKEYRQRKEEDEARKIEEEKVLIDKTSEKKKQDRE